MKASPVPIVCGARYAGSVTDSGAELDLFEDTDALRFTESGLLQAETSVGWILYF